MLLEAVVDAVAPVKGCVVVPAGRRKHPAELHLDKGYDYPRCRRPLRRRGITPDRPTRDRVQPTARPAGMTTPQLP
jgi:hypothetical protein